MQQYPSEASPQSWQGNAWNSPQFDPGSSGSDLFGSQLPDDGPSRRTGLVGWWLNLTSPPRPPAGASTEERERIRRAELTSLSILAVAAFLLALVSNSLADPSTGQAVGAMAIGLIIAAVLNRTGATRPWRTAVASILVPGLMLVLLMGATVQAKGGLSLIWLPAYDLMAIPIIISSLTARWRAPWVFAVLAMAFVVADFFLQPHALLNGLGANQFDDIAYETQIFGLWGMINRHVALMFFAGLIGSLGARSVENAIHRADRAEEIAAMEHQLVEQKRQLEYGIQQILATHVRVANGDFGARAPLTQDNVLFQIAASLNNLLNRLGRAAQSEYGMQRTFLEIQRLRDSLVAARSGRTPLWPAPSGTPVDMLLEVLAGPARNSALQQPGMAPNGPQPQFGTTSGPLMPPTSSRLGGGYAAPPGPYEQRRPEGNHPLQPNPFSGPQGGAPYPPYPGTPQAGAFAGPPGQPPASAGLGAFGQPGGSSGPFGRGSPSSFEPNSAPPAPQPPSAWEMPPLPDLPEDSGRG